MLYELEQGKNEKFLLEQAYKQNLPIPAKILNAPVLISGLEFYYKAFLDLCTCRPIGFGEGPIPWNAIKMYSDTHKLDEEEFDRLLTLVKLMDIEYLSFRQKQLDKAK